MRRIPSNPPGVGASFEHDPNALVRWFDEHSEHYDEETFLQDDNHYGGDVYRTHLVKDFLDSLRPTTVLDVGCGTAEPMLEFLKAGFGVQGFDISPGMVRRAKQKLMSCGFSPALVSLGDLLSPEIVERFGEQSFDAVIASGVLPYIQDTETAHSHIARLIKPGGHYIGAYSNELMDLMSLNRFTVQFHWGNFIEPLGLDDAEKRDVMRHLIGLLTYPDQPKSVPEGARDEIYFASHNPLTIGEKLAMVGLVQEDLLFYKFHAFAPLIKSASPIMKKVFMNKSRAYEIERARDWRGYFLASTFIVVARKVAEPSSTGNGTASDASTS